MNYAPYEAITADTLEAIQKAAAQNGINVTSGVFGYDLGKLVSLIPVNTPTYERFSRQQAPQGSDAATWRALLDVNNLQPNPFVGRDAGGNFIQIKTHDVATKYQPVRVSGRVTQDAIDLARGFADAKAVAGLQTLLQWRILANKAILAGQAVALEAITTPSLTAATTGGLIASGTTVYVKVAARSMLNYFWGGSGVASSAANVTVGTTTSTNKVTATVTAVRGAVGYDWWTSTNGSDYFWTTFTTINTAVFTAANTGTAAGSLPSAVVAGPDLYGTKPGNTPPASDTSYDTDSYNGLLATLSSDYSAAGPLVKYGTGDQASGATFTSLDGAALTGTAQSITELDELNAAIFATSQLSPTSYLISPQEAQSIANKSLGTNQAVTYINTSDSRTGLTFGGQVGGYINRITGQKIEFIVDPHMPYGTLIALTEAIPYPGANIGNVFEVRTQREVSQTDYGVSLTAGGADSGPRHEWDCSSMEAFVNRAPVACGVLSGIAAG